MDTETRKSPKRLVVEILDELHGQIKIHAAKRGISMRVWVNRALIRAVIEEEKYTNRK